MTRHVERELRRSLMQAAYRRGAEQVSPIAHVVGFWFFLSVAACLFGASVFFPMWQGQRQAVAAGKAIEDRLESLRTELASLQAVVGALHQDPVINERAALRELNFYVPGQEVVSTTPMDVVESGPELGAEQIQPHVPVCQQSWWSSIPLDWRSLDAWAVWACRQDVRRGLLLGAAFLVSAAFILFAPPAPRSLRHALVKPGSRRRSARAI